MNMNEYMTDLFILWFILEGHYSLSSIYTIEIPFVIDIQGVPKKYSCLRKN